MAKVSLVQRLYAMKPTVQQTLERMYGLLKAKQGPEFTSAAMQLPYAGALEDLVMAEAEQEQLINPAELLHPRKEAKKGFRDLFRAKPEVPGHYAIAELAEWLTEAHAREANAPGNWQETYAKAWACLEIGSFFADRDYRAVHNRELPEPMRKTLNAFPWDQQSKTPLLANGMTYLDDALTLQDLPAYIAKVHNLRALTLSMAGPQQKSRIEDELKKAFATGRPDGFPSMMLSLMYAAEARKLNGIKCEPDDIELRNESNTSPAADRYRKGLKYLSWSRPADAHYQFVKASDELLKAPGTHKEHYAAIQCQRITAIMEFGNFEGALADISGEISAWDESISAQTKAMGYWIAGRCEAKLKRYREAIPLLEQSLDAWPTHDAAAKLADAHERIAQLS